MRFIQDLTPQPRWSIGGTDLGVPIMLPGGTECLWVFGDTFEANGVGGPGWRSPVALRSLGQPVGSAPVVFTSAPGGGYAKQLFNYRHEPNNPDGISTVIPSDGVSIGDRVYLGGIVMRHHFGNVWWSELQYSQDRGETWWHTGAKFHDPMMQQMGFGLGDDGLVHAFTTTFDRKNDLHYYTVPAEKFTDPAAWKRHTFAGINARVGEFNLRQIGDRWYLGYFDAGRYRLALRWADTPANLAVRGKYTDITTVQGVGWPHNDVPRARMAQLYGGYVFGVDGDIGIVASHWNTETGWPYRAIQYHVNEITPVDNPVWDRVMTELRG